MALAISPIERGVWVRYQADFSSLNFGLVLQSVFR